MLVLANFIEEEQTVRLGWLPHNPVDLVTGQPVDRYKPIELEPYQFVWLAPIDSSKSIGFFVGAANV